MIFFPEQVVFGGGVTILNKYNNIENLEKFFNNIITKSYPHPLNTHLTFTQDVYIEGALKIRQNLNTKYLEGIQLDDWQNNLIFIDEDIQIYGQIEFEAIKLYDNITVRYLNGIDMDTIIPLDQPQLINGTFKTTSLLAEDLTVEGSVNGLNLQEAYENTVKVNTVNYT